MIDVDLAVLRAVTGRPVADAGFTATSLHSPVASATQGIWRVAGEGWAVVLKRVGHSSQGIAEWRSDERPESPYYWRREVEAYTSGLVASLRGGLRGPRVLASLDRSDGGVDLWLEDVGGTPASRWPLARYWTAARHLGQAQGEFLAGRPLPAQAWLSRGWLRAYVARRRVPIDLVEDVALRRLWDDRERFLDALDRLPRTLCHLDLHPANLFAGDAMDESTVLLDWAFCGLGAVGEDVGNLVPDSVLDFHVRPEQIRDLFDLVLAGYLDGLADAGWRGDVDRVSLGMAATIAAKYAWIVPRALQATAGGALLNGRPVETAGPWWRSVGPFLVEMGDLARRLA